MGKHNQLSTLLVEIIIAVMFFSFSATVILDTFNVTRSQSRQATVYNDALMEAQNIADKLYASGNFEETLQREGFEQSEQGWTLRLEEFDLQVTASQEETAAGVLLSAEVQAYHKGEALVELPCLRYIPGEVRP